MYKPRCCWNNGLTVKTLSPCRVLCRSVCGPVLEHWVGHTGVKGFGFRRFAKAFLLFCSFTCFVTHAADLLVIERCGFYFHSRFSIIARSTVIFPLSHQGFVSRLFARVPAPAVSCQEGRCHRRLFRDSWPFSLLSLPEVEIQTDLWAGWGTVPATTWLTEPAMTLRILLQSLQL